MDWNRLRYRPGQNEGHYESYYLRANDPAGARALWIRYTLFAPRGRPQEAIGEIWAIAFDRTRGHVAVKEERPFAQCRFAPTAFEVEVANARLDGAGLSGHAQSNGHRLAWDLRYGGGQPALLFMAPERYDAGFPAAKSLVSQPLARFDGWLEVDGLRWSIDGWRGSQNHNWGRRHTDRYAFGQVCGFDAAADSFLEVASARVRVGPLLTPTLTPLVLRHGGREHAFTGIAQALRNRGRRQGFDWQFTARNDALALAGRISAEPADFVGLRYYNPPGGVKVCLNSKIARCTLTLDHADGRREQLASDHGALFEILDDDGDDRVGIAA